MMMCVKSVNNCKHDIKVVKKYEYYSLDYFIAVTDYKFDHSQESD